MRSKWKGSFTELGELNNNSLVYSRRSTVLAEHVGKRISIYNGMKFVSILIKDFMVGYKLGYFVATKLLGSQIHHKKEKKVKAK